MVVFWQRTSSSPIFFLVVERKLTPSGVHREAANKPLISSCHTILSWWSDDCPRKMLYQIQNHFSKTKMISGLKQHFPQPFEFHGNPLKHFLKINWNKSVTIEDIQYYRILKQVNLKKEKDGHKLTRGSLLTKNFVFYHFLPCCRKETVTFWRSSWSSK